MLALVLVGLVCYANSLQGGHFILDDEPSIEANFDIQEIWPLWRSADQTANPPVNNRPVVRLSLALNYAFGELSIRGYRIFNIAVHILCALVLFMVVRNALRSRIFADDQVAAAAGLAFAIAMIWLVHPLQTQCVNHTIQRSTSLMALFYLLTLWCMQRGVETGAKRWFAMACMACVLGMGSKEAMVTAPIAVLLYDRTFVAGSWRRALQLRWGGYLGLAGGWVFLAIFLSDNPHGKSINLTEPYIAWHYALNQSRIILEHYLAKLIWPYPLSNFYGPIRYVLLADIWPYALSLLGLLALTAYALIRRPPVGFAAAWFFLLLAPTSSFAAIFWEAMAERRPYLAQVGLIALLVVSCHAGLCRLVREGRLSPKAMLWGTRGSLLLIVAFLASITISRNRDYQDLQALWGAEVEYLEAVMDELPSVLPKVAYHHAEVYVRLGRVFADVGEWRQAEENYNKALQLSPDHFKAHKWLGHMFKELNETDQSIYHFRLAIGINPQAYNAHNALGALLCMRGEVEEGVEHLRLAVEISPNYVWARSNLGAALRMLGREEEARQEFQRALIVAPNFAPALENLAAIAD